MEWMRQTLEGLKALLTEMWDVLKVFGGVFELLGGLANFLGPFGFSLFLLSLLTLGFVGSFSPLTKLQNYIIVVVGMIVLAMSAGGGNIAVFGKYVLIMAMPLIIVYGLKYFLEWAGRQIFKSPRVERLRRAEELTLQLSKEIAALKAGS